MNNLNLHKVKKNKFPLVGLLNKLPKHSSLFETVLITINDYLVYKFLDRTINFQDLTKLINKISTLDDNIKDADNLLRIASVEQLKAIKIGMNL